MNVVWKSVNKHLTTLCACMSPPVPPEDPVVDGSPELLLMAGTPYNLTCVTRGAKPAAHIQWTKDRVPVEGAYHSTVIHIHYYTQFISVIPADENKLTLSRVHIMYLMYVHSLYVHLSRALTHNHQVHFIHLSLEHSNSMLFREKFTTHQHFIVTSCSADPIFHRMQELILKIFSSFVLQYTVYDTYSV